MPDEIRLVAHRTVTYERDCPTCGSTNRIAFHDGMKTNQTCKHYIGMVPKDIRPNSEDVAYIVFGKE